MTPSYSPEQHCKGTGSEKSAGLALGPGFSVFVVTTDCVKPAKALHLFALQDAASPQK